ncbi:putative sulfate transporter 4.2 [Sesbania bispinosa]|nr:putative sulfate transporter 4.2 [Sesbania bispinosa]
MPSSPATAARPVRVIPLQHPTVTTSSSSSSPNVAFSRWTSKLRRMTWLEWIEFFLPCCRWIRTYKWREYFQVDLMAGITVGVMLVPQNRKNRLRGKNKRKEDIRRMIPRARSPVC